MHAYRIVYVHARTGKLAPRYDDPGSPFHGDLFDAVAQDCPHDLEALKVCAADMVREGRTCEARVQKRDFAGRWRAVHTVSDWPVDGPTCIMGHG